MVMVVVQLSLFYFHEKYTRNPNHNHPMYSMNPKTPHGLITPTMIVHAHGTSLEILKTKNTHEKVNKVTALTLQSMANKDNNRFDFFVSTRPKPMIDFDLHIQPKPSTTTTMIQNHKC